MIDQEQHSDDRFVKNGASITVHLPRSFFVGDGTDLQIGDDDEGELSSSIPLDTKHRFLQIRRSEMRRGSLDKLLSDMDWEGDAE